MRARKFYIFTLGCKINQYESEAIRESWILRGYEEVDNVRDAHIILINSCAVTQTAISDLRKYIRRFSRENPSCEIIVTGCAIPKWEKSIKKFGNVKITIPQKQKQILKDYPIPLEPNKIGEENSNDNFSLNISNYFRARPLVKIQDGCSQCCKYCIVPLSRGPSRSRNVDDILNEVKRLLDKGFKEIIISGINLRQFKANYKEKSIDVWDLVDILSKFMQREYKDSRIRLSSLDPALLNNKALSIIQKCKNLTPHLHLSIQSADKTVLKNMGRDHYTPEDILGFIDKLKQIWPIFGLGCDILVGYPGEDDRCFEVTYEFCKKMPFSYGHVFQYSRRPGTPAAKFTNQVPKEVKKERSRLLRDVFLNKRIKFLNKLLNLEEVNIVVEDKEKMVGMNEYYVICKIKDVIKNKIKKGDLIKGKPVDVDLDDKNLVVKSVEG